MQVHQSAHTHTSTVNSEFRVIRVSIESHWAAANEKPAYAADLGRLLLISPKNHDNSTFFGWLGGFSRHREPTIQSHPRRREFALEQTGVVDFD